MKEYRYQQIATISEVFSISETYLGSYFKRQCGETIQHFISNYKIRLIEHRLRFSSMRINEIASEFAFSDKSHLNKFFKNIN
jgi:AraC-like DNA-binding protein